MKKFLSLFLCILLILLSVIPVSAFKGDEILSQMTEGYENECNDVRLAVLASLNEYEAYIGSNEEEIDFSLMYRCYNLDSDDLTAVYDENNGFYDNISDDYFWIVPNYEKGGEVEVVPNSESEFGWSIRGALMLHEKADIEKVYNTILTDYPNVDASSFVNVYNEEINCKLIYFTAEGVEYLCPMFLSAKDPEWANSGEVYEAEEFCRVAVPEFDDEIKDSGVVSWFQANLDVIIMISAAVLLTAAVIVFVIVIKKKKDAE